ncbi:MAG: hypothetical protein P4L85_27525 [Paludisphaera borealis]|uniref:hypothetical protein n=1 Tax=Paludisphaera borealis TaxID=1387353 RepID=UPI00284DF561|nr:hypothetical protein [Paludisphaera borealis]MDR3623134.1 hypothetical protein [Paludisphaera borealis]
MFKIAAVASSVLVSLGLAAIAPPPPPPGGPDEPRPKAKGKEAAKKKEDRGPAGDLTKAYDLLRRLRADATSNGRPEERIRDWTERSVKYYRDGLKALDAQDEFLAHEYGAVAHGLARAADHAQKAAQFDRRDPDLPPPPEGVGPGDSGERARRDLNRAYDRITESADHDPAPGAGVYLKAARDLYTAARRDVEAGREERGGELARAAEAMTHVVEHLGHAAAGPPEGRDRPGLRSGVRREPPPPPDRPEPKEKAKRSERRDLDLPPPLPPE